MQFFLADPQGWKKPPDRSADADAAAGHAGIELYVHAPYLVNVATTNNRIRIPSRKLLSTSTPRRPPTLGAQGPDRARRPRRRGRRPAGRLRQLAQGVRSGPRAASTLPILIENTAGGRQRDAPAGFDGLARLWDAVGDFDVGFCLDTCHAHAGGEELLDIVDRVKAITGRIDLVHANDSRDAFDSGARPARQPRPTGRSTRS